VIQIAVLLPALCQLTLAQVDGFGIALLLEEHISKVNGRV
jgi:hypothetical protein